MSKLTRDQVAEIKGAHRGDVHALCVRYGVHDSTGSRIRSGHLHRYVEPSQSPMPVGDRTRPSGVPALTPEQVAQIRAVQPGDLGRLCRDMGIYYSAGWRCKNGHTYAETGRSRRRVANEDDIAPAPSQPARPLIHPSRRERLAALASIFTIAQHGGDALHLLQIPLNQDAQKGRRTSR